jgi:hypothetical protein
MFMALQRRKAHARAWRVRREEYLRASGRRSDLVKEGFEPGINGANWSVIRGGRASTCPNHDSPTPLVVVTHGFHGGDDLHRRHR